MKNEFFQQMDFGPLEPLLLDDDITDISYDNNGQIWLDLYLKVFIELRTML